MTSDVVALGGVLTAVLGALGGWGLRFYVARADRRSRDIRDAISEYQAIMDRQNRAIDQLQQTVHDAASRCSDEMEKLRAKASGDMKCLQDANRRLENENGDLRGEIRLLQLGLAQLRSGVPDGFGVTGNASIICDQDGKILQVNPPATALFHWLEHELLGQHVTVLIAPRFREAHEAAFRKAIATRVPPDPNRVITDVAGITREDIELPVSVSMSGWESRGKIYFHAEIVRSPMKVEP